MTTTKSEPKKPAPKTKKTRTPKQPEKYDIFAAINAVMLDVGCVTGTGNNQHHGYTYASEHDILLKLQASMATHGIAIEKEETEIVQYEYMPNKNRWHAVVKIPYVLHLTDSKCTARLQSKIRHVCIGAGEDGADKALPKAMTMAYKYLFRQAFALPTGDDPDATENSTPSDEGESNKNVIILDVPFKESKDVKALGARPKWDKTGKKDLFLHWWVYDTEENQEKFKAWIPKPQIEIFKSWAAKNYGSFAAVEAFTTKYVNTKNSPIEWDDQRLAAFMDLLDTNGHNLASKYDIFYRNEWGRDEFENEPAEIKNHSDDPSSTECNGEYQHNEELPF
tara:strand:+ start:162 stop:1169 length:1008 start_codon:yes stop_codon:yes gene_type:complete